MKPDRKTKTEIRITCEGAATIPLEKLLPLQGDLKSLPEDNFKKLKASILKHGVTFPFFVWKNAGKVFIIDAHQRDKVLRRLSEEGYTVPPVPVVWIEARDEKEAKEKILLCNSQYGEMTDASLGEFINTAMLDLDQLKELTVLPIDLNSLLPKPVIDVEPQIDNAAELAKKWKTKTGQLWQLGEHRLLCGDSTKCEDVARLLGKEKPMLMVTDPPYGVEYDANWRNEADRANGKPYGARAVGKVTGDSECDWTEAWRLFPGDVAYVWHADRHASRVQASVEIAGFEIRCQIVWAKNTFAIGRGDYHWQHEPCWYAVRKCKRGQWSGDRSQTTLWEIDKPQKSETGHSTQKPIECMARPIRKNSKKGDAVYDPFLGSGTTLIACENLGRRCFGLEISPDYVAVTLQRFLDSTGKKPVLISK